MLSLSFDVAVEASSELPRPLVSFELEWLLPLPLLLRLGLECLLLLALLLFLFWLLLLLGLEAESLRELDDLLL